MRVADPLFAEAVIRDSLGAFPFVEVTALGSCMAPDICHGDRVRLVAVARRRPRIGEVVLVKQPEGLRLHRFVWGPPLAPAQGPWRTRADRAGGVDPAVWPKAILASVILVEGTRLVPRRLGPTLKAAWRALTSRIYRRPGAMMDP